LTNLFGAAYDLDANGSVSNAGMVAWSGISTNAGVDETQLDASVNASLDLADGSVQITDPHYMRFTIGADTNWNNEGFAIWQNGTNDITLQDIRITVAGAAAIGLVWNIEERAWASLASAGSRCFTNDLYADADGLQASNFSNATIAANAHVVFTTPASNAETGTVDLVTGVIRYVQN